jgi:hypothetical protein
MCIIVDGAEYIIVTDDVSDLSRLFGLLVLGRSFRADLTRRVIVATAPELI